MNDLHVDEQIDALRLVKLLFLEHKVSLLGHIDIESAEVLCVLVIVIELEHQNVEEVEDKGRHGPNQHASLGALYFDAQVTTPDYPLELACQLKLLVDEPECDSREP